MFIRILSVLLVIVAGFWLYVRFAPNDPAAWHQMPEITTPGDRLDPGGFQAVRRITGTSQEVLEAVARIADATPRTRLVAGSARAGMMTYQTRSRLWGFPDHTTVAVQGDLLVIYGRLRFGRADLGVNKARVESWLAALGPLTEPL